MVHAKNVTWILVGLLTILVLINTYTALSINGLTNDLAATADEANRPAKIQLVTLTNAACTDCYDVTTVADAIKTENVEITEEKSIEYTDAEAQALIETYGIEKIPTIIVTGELSKATLSGLEERDDALILADLTPVYYDISSGTYRGRIQIKQIINEDCEECYDMDNFIQVLQTVMVISSQETVNLADAEEDIAMYNLAELSAIIISGDLELYPEIVPSLEALGTYVGEELILTSKLNPPYWDLTENEVKGLVTITYLTDESCGDCYNVNVHTAVLENYGLYLAEELTIDISSTEGQEILEKYEITKVPTIILSADASHYQAITDVWESVGTIENDGSYVFRELDLVSGNYTSL